MTKYLRLFVSFGLLSWLAWRTDWVQVGEVFSRLRIEYWVAAVLMYAFIQVISGYRWQRIAEPLGFRIPLSRYVGFYYIGMFFNLVLPTSVGGDVIRACYLNSRSGRRRFAFLSVLSDRLSGFVVLFGLAGLAVLLCPITLPLWVTWSVFAAVVAAYCGLACLPVFIRLNRRLRFSLGRRFDNLGSDLLHSLRFAFRPSILLLSLVIQSGNILIVWLLGLSISAPIAWWYYWIVVPMVALLTLLPVSINGMGVREGGMVLFLAPMAVREGMAMSLAFLWFSVFTVTSLVAGGLVYLFGRFPPVEVEADTAGRTSESVAHRLAA
ncbi:MAG: hypothetical protein KatS3mg105_0200 [Gemmatales bacterium]|nr:MAG: hypothetical protein KatS3mg105_0200 [Gemmatales bacterium]